MLSLIIISCGLLVAAVGFSIAFSNWRMARKLRDDLPMEFGYKFNFNSARIGMTGWGAAILGWIAGLIQVIP